MNPEDIGDAREIYFEQHSRVIDTSASINRWRKWLYLEKLI